MRTGRPLAYLITFSTYGTHLHGDQRGSVDVRHNMLGTPVLPVDPRRAAAEAARLNFEPYTLSLEARRVVDQTVREVCGHKRWRLLALNVRTNHVHLVVGADVEGSAVMTAVKAWSSRRLAEAGLIERGRTVWTSGGSKRKLWTRLAVDNGVDYVLDGQGDNLL